MTRGMLLIFQWFISSTNLTTRQVLDRAGYSFAFHCTLNNCTSVSFRIVSCGIYNDL